MSKKRYTQKEKESITKIAIKTNQLIFHIKSYKKEKKNV